MICFVGVFFLNPKNDALIALTPISFIAFFGYFAVQFLGLDINLPPLSIRKRVSYLENNQKELKHIVTAFYKLHRISVALRDIKGSSTKIAKMNFLIEDEIKHLLDDNEIDTFSEELSNIIKNPN